MILPTGEVLEKPNRAENPERDFRFDEGDLVGAAATWHTHPTGGSNLSIADYYFFLSWSRLLHFIIYQDDIRCYLAVNSEVLVIDEEKDLPARLPEGSPQ